MISIPQELCKTSLASDLADCVATLRERYGLLEFYPPNASFVVLYKDHTLKSYINTHFIKKNSALSEQSPFLAKTSEAVQEQAAASLVIHKNKIDSSTSQNLANSTQDSKNCGGALRALGQFRGESYLGGNDCPQIDSVASNCPPKSKSPQISPIILAQTDTTVGFLSQSPTALNLAKHRPINQAVLATFASLQCAKQTHRIPRIHHHFVRQANKISIILSNKKSFRVVKDPLHREFLSYFGGLYSTSANRTKESFSLEFALRVADIIALDSRGLYEDKPSTIYRLSRTRKRRTRW